MFLSDVSVKRPVFATVVNLLLVVFGVVSISLLSLREYPDIDPPVVSINTNYPGVGRWSFHSAGPGNGFLHRNKTSLEFGTYIYDFHDFRIKQDAGTHKKLGAPSSSQKV